MAALDVVTPTRCAGCGQLDQILCDACGADLFGPPHRADLAAPLLGQGPPTWAATQYTGPVRDIVLAWKRGRRDVRPIIDAAAYALVDRWAALPENQREGGAVMVVPAPSGWVRRARGLLVAGQLAESVASALREVWPNTSVDVADVVRRRGFGHLAGLGASARAATRIASTLRIHRVPTADAWELVDDVVTTGATLRATAEALSGATGQPVEVAFTLAATPRKSRRDM